MSAPVHIRSVPVKTQSIASGPVACPAGAETVVKSLTLRDGGYPYLAALALYVDGATTLVKWRFYLGGVLLPCDYHERATILGEIGNPQRISPIELSPTTVLEIRAYNGDGVAFNCECDGEVEYHARPQ